MNPLIIQKSIAVCNYIIINKLNQINLLNNQSLEKRYESRKIKKIILEKITFKFQ